LKLAGKVGGRRLGLLRARRGADVPTGAKNNLVSFGRTGYVEKHFGIHLLHGERSCWNFIRAYLPLVAGLGCLLGITSCGLPGSKADPSAATPIISVSITQAPPLSMVAGSAVPVSATVSNDPADAGVDWVATCGSAPYCGSFSSSHTASGSSTTFIAPTRIPASATTVVTALSTTNRGVQVVASVTILTTITGITIAQPPPASVPVLVKIPVAAAVYGDIGHNGVDWTATCGTSGVQRTPVNCTSGGYGFQGGSYSPDGTISFLVPPSDLIPNIVGSTVTLTAYPAADHSFSASVSFTVTAEPTVVFTQLPPSTMQAGSTVTVAAAVPGDTTNAGVDWSVPCADQPCGSISPTHTASGGTVTYTAPLTPSVSNLVVPIMATSHANPLASATANVTIIVSISVTITQGVPTGSIIENTTASLIATVAYDPSVAGVDWTVTCGSPGACGSFSPPHTASGAATTFTAPNGVPAGNIVTITATSTTDPTKNAVQTVTITVGKPANSLLSGTFVLLLNGKNSNNGPYALGGTITGDGGGNISKARIDLVDASGNAVGAESIKPSTYSITPDGRGLINLAFNTNNLTGKSFGVNGSGVITLSVVFVNGHHAVLTETDSFGSGSGTLDLQNSSDLASFEGGSWNSGIYSLELSGSETSPPYRGYSVASGLTISNIFSESAYSYVTDQLENGKITSVQFSTQPQNFTPVWSNMLSGELELDSVNLGLPAQFYLDVWLIDANHFVVTDWIDPAFNGATNVVGGYLTIQPSTPSLSGTYAFAETGATVAAQPQAAGGILTCGSTGVLDVIPLGGPAVNDQPINASCVAPANGRGLLDISATSGGSTNGISTFAAYPTLDQGLYLIELDPGATGTSGPSGTGVAQQQALSGAGTIASGAYASDFLATTALGSQNLAGQVNSDGVSALSGTANANFFDSAAVPQTGPPSFNATLSGSFTASANGRLPLTLAIVPAAGQPTPGITTLNAACYLVNANSCLLLGLDTTAPGTGLLLLQNTGL